MSHGAGNSAGAPAAVIVSRAQLALVGRVMPATPYYGNVHTHAGAMLLRQAGAVIEIDIIAPDGRQWWRSASRHPPRVS